ncbi:MAG: GNAT family N-acetyltransferase [Rubripirellula sp.]
MSVTIRNECNSDQALIFQLNQSAFGGDDEANLVDSLRDGGFVTLSMVAVVNGQLVGHLLFSKLAIITEDGSVDAISLAPMAVHADHQRQGIGTKLVKTALHECRQQAHKIAVVLGHPKYYPRFGFSCGLAKPLISPFGDGDAWMAQEFEPNALKGVSGTVKYPPPFEALGNE